MSALLLIVLFPEDLLCKSVHGFAKMFGKHKACTFRPGLFSVCSSRSGCPSQLGCGDWGADLFLFVTWISASCWVYPLAGAGGAGLWGEAGGFFVPSSDWCSPLEPPGLGLVASCFWFCPEVLTTAHWLP